MSDHSDRPIARLRRYLAARRRGRFQFSLRSLLLAMGMAAVAVGLYAWYDNYRTRHDPLPWEGYSPAALDEHLRRGRTVLIVCDYQPGIFCEWDPDAVVDAQVRYIVRTQRVVPMAALVQNTRQYAELARDGQTGKPRSLLALIYRPSAPRMPIVCAPDGFYEDAIAELHQWIIHELNDVRG